MKGNKLIILAILILLGFLVLVSVYLGGVQEKKIEKGESGEQTEGVPLPPSVTEDEGGGSAEEGLALPPAPPGFEDGGEAPGSGSGEALEPPAPPGF